MSSNQLALFSDLLNNCWELITFPVNTQSIWVCIFCCFFYDVKHVFAHNGTVSGDSSCADGHFKATS